MRVKLGERYKIVATDPLFADWRGVVAECKAEVSGLYEMHANNAYIYCEGRHLRVPREKKTHNAEVTGAPISDDTRRDEL